VGEWTVDPKKNTITRKSEVSYIEPKAMAVLLFLLAHKNSPVSIEVLLSNLWPNVVVTENTVRRTMAQLRRAFKDDASDPTYISTIPKKGYCLIAKTSWINTDKFSIYKRINSPFFSITIAIIATLFLLNIYLSDNNELNWLRQTSLSQVTSLPGRELAPSFSFDGKYLAFIHAKPNENIYQLNIRDLDRDKPFLIESDNMSVYSPVWSEDHNFIAFADLTQCIVYIAQLAKDKRSFLNTKSIYQCTANTLPQLAWSNDGRYLYFNDQNIHQFSYQQYRFDIKTEQITRINFGDNAPPNGFLKLLPHPSLPLWLLISFNEKDNTQLWLYDEQTSELKKLFEHAGFSHSAAWCGKPEKILLSLNNDLFEINIDGSYSSLQSERELSYIACSRTDESILFADRMRNHSLIKVNNPRTLNIEGYEKSYIHRSTLGEENPVWSSTSNKLAFVTNREGNWAFAHSQNKMLVLHSLENFTIRPEILSWSPNDLSLLILQQGVLGILDLESSRISWLTDLGNDIISASWSKDNDKIYYSSMSNKRTNRFDIKNKVITYLFDQASPYLKENSTEKLLYYINVTQEGLWQFDIETNEHKLIYKNIPVSSRLQVFEHGFYYHHHHNDSKGINYYNFADKTVESIIEGEHDIGHQFSISPDEREIVFEEWDSYLSDIKKLTPKLN
jgi:transcriptional activator of cad operon